MKVSSEGSFYSQSVGKYRTDNLTKTTNTHKHIAEYNHTKRNPTKR